MAGYSKTPLVKKLGIKAGDRVAFVHAPEHYLDLLGELPNAVDILTLADAPLNFIHAFYTESEHLLTEFPQLKAALTKDGLVWISWYKKAAKMDTDLTGDSVRQMGLDAGLVDVKVAAVDEQWSGLKFVYRLEDRT